MTDRSTWNDGQDFGQKLTDLIATATRNGIDVNGGWKCTVDGNGDEYWNVEITRVEYDE